MQVTCRTQVLLGMGKDVSVIHLLWVNARQNASQRWWLVPEKQSSTALFLSILALAEMPDQKEGKFCYYKFSSLNDNILHVNGGWVSLREVGFESKIQELLLKILPTLSSMSFNVHLIGLNGDAKSQLANNKPSRTFGRLRYGEIPLADHSLSYWSDC